MVALGLVGSRAPGVQAWSDIPRILGTAAVVITPATGEPGPWDPMVHVTVALNRFLNLGQSGVPEDPPELITVDFFFDGVVKDPALADRHIALVPEGETLVAVMTPPPPPEMPSIGWDVSGTHVYFFVLSAAALQAPTDRFAVLITIPARQLVVGTAVAEPNLCDGQRATVVGTAGNDFLYGAAGADVLLGLAGDDQLYGSAGDDRLCGGLGDDQLHGDNGQDRLFGGAGADVLRGGGHADSLNGGAGHDILYGESNTDVLIGGPGLDVCDGGVGQDTATGCELTAGVP